MRNRRCKICKKSFPPRNSFQMVCSPTCAMLYARGQEDKARAKALQVRKEKLKSRGQWASEAQAACNTYVRARDAGLPCISCGKYHTGQLHAGHYRSVGGNPELRFYTLNIHVQCQPCNCHRSGNLIDYRIGLLKRYGPKLVEKLEGPQTFNKYTIEELKRLKDIFKRKTKALKSRRRAKE